MLTIEINCLQDFGRFAKSEIQRHLKSLRDIESTIDELLRIKTATDALAVSANEWRKTILSLSEPMDPNGMAILGLNAAQRACQITYESLQIRRDNAVRASELHADEGVIETYNAVLDATAYLCNSLNELCWALGEHDADFEQPTGKHYTDIEEMFHDIGV